jgi:hypothetical protein
MHWFGMNIPLAATIFAIWTGVPLWLVLRHPDTGPESRVLDSGPGSRVPDTDPGSRVRDTGPESRVPDTPRRAQPAL